MLDNITKARINTARDILVSKVPDPKGQVEQITIALIYKFMDDMDKESVNFGGEAPSLPVSTKNTQSCFITTHITASVRVPILLSRENVQSE